eukprot:TRINITY_DN1304_c0_g1_i2.p1 TRINITY_DN1304_c0_g1~~TRINITY_DN1304_c0_g1_i2.p1  ORF type:complete len:218 (-),score=36.41 TRINITY_DN1304_c0_g1_i2:54-707(-)
MPKVQLRDVVTDTNFIIGFTSGAIAMLIVVVFFVLGIFIIKQLLKTKREKTQYIPVINNENEVELQYVTNGTARNVYVIEDDEDEEKGERESITQKLQLKSHPDEVDPNDFQVKWTTLELSGTLQLRLHPGSDVEKILATKNIVCLATGAVEGNIKFYFYAQDKATDVLFMIETIVWTSQNSYELTANIKCEDTKLGGQFIDYLRTVLSTVAVKSSV